MGLEIRYSLAPWFRSRSAMEGWRLGWSGGTRNARRVQHLFLTSLSLLNILPSVFLAVSFL